MTSNDGLSFLAGGGEMGALIRQFDWSKHPLGPPQNWPQPLRTAVRLILNTGHPMYIWWGQALYCFYNDAYRQSIGPERHPGSLGQPGREVWYEIWDIIGPQVEQVLSGGGATWSVNALVPITRHGRREDVYWTYSYSPIDDETAPDSVGGILVVCTETTETVLAEQRQAEASKHLHQTFQQAPGFIIVMNGPDHVVEFVNETHKRLFDSGDWIGKPVREAIPSIAGQGFFEQLDKVYATGTPHEGVATEIRYTRTPGAPSETRYINFIFAPWYDGGEITGIFCEGFDVTDARKSELARRESEDRYQALFNAIDQGFCIIDVIFDDDGKAVDYVFLDVNESFGRQTGLNDVVGKRIRELVSDHEEQWFEAYGRIAKTGRSERFEAAAEGLGRYYEVFAFRLGGPTDRRVGILFNDIRDRKRAEEERLLLTRELAHRVKNALAVAQALAMQTSVEDGSIEEYRRKFTDRLRAFSRSHGILVDHDWRFADVRTLVDAAIQPFCAERPDHIVVEGPEVTITPRRALGLNLVLHELSTNAAKYGSLSDVHGTLSIRWSLDQTASPARLRFVWQEENGPAVTPPDRKGFGTTLIERASEHELEGEASLNYSSTGVRYEVAFPVG